MAIKRTYDPTHLELAAKDYGHTIQGFEPVELVCDLFNICLVNDEGDVTLFEYHSPNTYEGHYFLVNRGVKALKVCREMLHEIFTGDYEAKVLLGYTPLDNIGALKMNKALGFKQIVQLERGVGPEVMVCLTKNRYEKELNSHG
jgi:hypothetical protein